MTSQPDTVPKVQGMEPKQKKSTSIKEILYDFCGYTNIHGLGRIVAGKAFVSRLFWVTLCVAAYGMCLYQCYMLVTEYLARPTVTLLTLKHEMTAKFPAVTVCNLNIARKSKLPEHLKLKIEEIQRRVDKEYASDDSYEEISVSPVPATSRPPQLNDTGNADDGYEAIDEVLNSTTGGVDDDYELMNSTTGKADDGTTSPPGDFQQDETGSDRRKRRNSDKLTANDQNQDELGNGDDEEGGDENNEEQEDGKPFLGDKDKSESVYSAIVDELAESTPDELSEMGHQLRDLVQTCNFKGHSCSNFTANKYWVRHWNSRFGNCFTFNSGHDEFGKPVPVLYSKKTGLQDGLKISLNVEQEEYLSQLSQAAGVKVVVHPQGQMPFPNEEGFFASPGHSTAIGLSKQIIEREDPFNNGSCNKNNILPESNMYRKFANASVYTNKACTKHCQAEHQIRACNCTSIDFPFPGYDGCRISNPKEFACFNRVNKAYIDRKLGCEERCPNPCREDVVLATTSLSEWPSAVYEPIMPVFNSTEQKVKEGKTQVNIPIRRNYLQVRVFFEQLNYQKVTEKLAYPIESLAADIGGTLGLWIGVSVLASAEVLELIVLVLFSCLRRKPKERKEMIGDTPMTNMIE